MQEIQIYGSGCPTCKTLHAQVSEIVSEIGSSIEVEYITDIAKMAELGVMSSPVLVIDGKVIFAGRPPSTSDLRTILLARYAL